MACGGGHPLLRYVGGDRALRQPDLTGEGRVVVGEDDVEGAVRPHLDASFAHLVDDVFVVPS